MITFGDKIKDLRKEKNLTQKELAQALSITISTLSHWECDYQEPSFKDLVLLASYFCVSTDYLLGTTDDNGSFNVQNNALAISSEEQEWINILSSLAPLHRTQVLEYARYFAQREKNTKKSGVTANK